MSNTYDEVRKSKRLLLKFENNMCFLMQELSFVLVEMAVFLLMGLTNRSGYPHFWVWSAFFSYLITSILTRFLEKSGYVNTSLFSDVKYSSNDRKRIVTVVSTILIPSLICISCYMLLVLSTDRFLGENYQFYYSIIALFIGSISSRMLRLPQLPLQR